MMTYTSYDGVARLCVATSRDLVQWEKHGPVFARAHGGAFADAWTKSGAIVCRLVAGRLVAAKLPPPPQQLDPAPSSRLRRGAAPGAAPHEVAAAASPTAHGVYYMYWGENSIYVATSENLLDWTPLLDPSAPEYRGRPDQPSSALRGYRPLRLFGPRRGRFDSGLVEPGPPALLTAGGIVFICEPTAHLYLSDGKHHKSNMYA